MIEVGRRARTLPPPPHIVLGSLRDPHRVGTRPWLDLQPGEVEPRILLEAPPDRLVWSSLWADRPDDEIHFHALSHGAETRLVVTHLTPDAMPDEETTRRLRRRVSELLWRDLQESYDN
ncbi:MAG TPA: hypothetical protein VGE77_10855 [Nocardioides sp.]